MRIPCTLHALFGHNMNVQKIPAMDLQEVLTYLWQVKLKLKLTFIQTVT
jgi:hypothetical protein